MWGLATLSPHLALGLIVAEAFTQAPCGANPVTNSMTSSPGKFWEQKHLTPEATLANLKAKLPLART